MYNVFIAPFGVVVCLESGVLALRILVSSVLVRTNNTTNLYPRYRRSPNFGDQFPSPWRYFLHENMFSFVRDPHVSRLNLFAFYSETFFGVSRLRERRLPGVAQLDEL